MGLENSGSGLVGVGGGLFLPRALRTLRVGVGVEVEV